MRLLRFVFLPLLFIAQALLCASAQAGLTIRGSRVIYYEAEKETSVFFQNMNAYPVLVQAWLDDGDQAADPGSQLHPFILLPALDRVDPGKGQTIRILGTGESNFPRDRESILWFNLHEMPPAPTDFTGNYMQVAGRARLKFFYRPPGLPSAPELMHEGLRFELAPQDGKMQVRVKNLSPYHVTITDMAVRRKGQPDAALPQAEMQAGFDGMVYPMNELLIPLTGRAVSAGMEMTVQIKNDDGAAVRGKVVLGEDGPMAVDIPVDR